MTEGHSLSLYFRFAALPILHSAHLWKNGAATFTVARIPMPDGASALQLVFGGDPALYSVVALSLYVSLFAVVLAALVALPFGAFLALTHFPGRTFIVVLINAFMGLPPVVVGLAVYLLQIGRASCRERV